MLLREILVRATNWVGDAVMSVPALQALRAEYPGARISILAKPWVAGLYGREPFCDELIPYNAPRGWKGLGAKWQTALGLRNRKFDCAILFQNALEAAVLVRVARIPVRIGYDRDGRGFLLTHPISPPSPGEIPRHERYYYLELLKRAGLIPDYDSDSPIRLNGAVAAALAGRQMLKRFSIEGSVIGVCPGAAYGGAKRWLPERFAEAAAQISSISGATLMIFGSPEEKSICDVVEQSLQQRGKQVFNLAGRTTLSEFIDIAAACELFLTNDSGPMHIASALGVPTVTVFGPTDEIATGPTGDQSRVVRYPVKCSPCLLRECPIDHRCMRGVQTNLVVKEAVSLLTLGMKGG